MDGKMLAPRKLATAEDHRNEPLSLLLANAHAELDMGIRGGQSNAFGFVRVMGERLERELCGPDGALRPLERSEESMWRRVFDKALPPHKLDNCRNKMLVEMKKDLVSLKGFTGIQFQDDQIDDLMKMISELCLEYRAIERANAQVRGEGPGR